MAMCLLELKKVGTYGIMGGWCCSVCGGECNMRGGRRLKLSAHGTAERWREWEEVKEEGGEGRL